MMKMVSRRTVALALAASAVLAAPQAAQAATKKVAAFDPAYAWAVVEVRNLNDALFEGTKFPGTLTLARYDPVGKDVRGGAKSPDTALPKGQALRVTLSSKPVAKTKAGRLYMARLDPDIWVIEGSGTTAFSLGSLSFEAKPGQILDLGVMAPQTDWAEGETPTKINAGSILKMGIMGGLIGKGMPDAKQLKMDWRAREAGDIPLPASLSGKTVVLPAYSYGASFGNYLGGLVNRIDGRAGRARAQAEAAMKAVGVVDAPPAPAESAPVEAAPAQP